MQRLYRYEVQIHADESASSTARVPVASATVAVYRQGARANGSGAGVTALVVHDLGSLGAGDNLAIGDTDTTGVAVSTINSSTSITLDTSSTWEEGERFLNLSDRPTIYSDNQGVDSLGNSTTTDSSGYAMWYARESVLDVEVTDSDSNKSVLVDVPGVSVPDVVKVDDWGTKADGTTDDYTAINNALTYLSNAGGGTLEFGTGTYSVETAITIGFSNITIRGQGQGLTTLKINQTAGVGIQFTGASKSNARISNLTLTGIASTTGLISVGSGWSDVTIEDVDLAEGAVGIYDAGTDTRINRVSFSGGGTNAWSKFLYFESATRPHVTSMIGRATNSLGAFTAFVDIDDATKGARLSNIDIEPPDGADTDGGMCLIIQDNASSTPPRDIKVINSRFVGGYHATNGYPAIRINDCEGVELIGVTCEDSDIGIDINGGTSIKIIGGSDVYINDDGIDIDGGSHIRIVERESSNVNVSNTSKDHVNIAAGVDDVSINGLTVGRFIRGTGTAQARYGVSIESGASERIQVIGLRGAITDLATGWYLNASSANSVDISHNIEDGNNRSYSHTALAGVGENTGGVVGVITVADATSADVENVGVVKLDHTGAISFATLNNGVDGQVVKLIALDGNTTLVETGNLNIAGGSSFAMATGDVVSFMYESGTLDAWYEVARGDVS